MSPDSVSGSVYYIVHDMIIKAALFLLIGIMIKITGTSDLTKMSGLIKRYPGLAWTFFLAAASLAGIPPLSGFFGKLLIISGGFAEGFHLGAVVVLLSSLLILFSVMKIFIYGFWGEPRMYPEEGKTPVKSLLIAPVLLVLLSIAMGVGSEVILPYISMAVETLLNPDIYIDAVLKE